MFLSSLEVGPSSKEGANVGRVFGLGRQDEPTVHWLQSTAVFGDTLFAMCSPSRIFAKRQGTGGDAGHLILFWYPEEVRRGGKSGRWLLRRRPVAASATNYHGLRDDLSCSGDRDFPPSVCFAHISSRGLRAGCRVRAATAPAKDLAPLEKGFLDKDVTVRAAGDRCSGDSLSACAASAAAGSTWLRTPSPGFREHSGRPRRGGGRHSEDPPLPDVSVTSVERPRAVPSPQ